MTKNNILEINNLTVDFRRGDVKDAAEGLQGDLIAVKGVSLSLAKGETLALVGESGCGKTVLCKSILKLLCEKGRIHEGEIKFDGEDLAPLSEKEMRRLRGSGIAMVFQDPAMALDPAFSVGRQIVEVLRLHKGMSRKDAELYAVQLLEKVQITDASGRFHQRPYQFSGGMRQRVAVAMALAAEPELLIADEPTTALDEETQQEILKLLKEVQRETSAAMLFITHDLSIVEQMAEKVAIMQEGIIVEQGSVTEVFASPRHQYTRQLLEHIGKGKHDLHEEAAEKVQACSNGRMPYCCDTRQRLLSIENLSKSFSAGRRSSVAVLENFSMELHRGEITGLVGPSGCGKTTLARCIMGIEKPDSGKISRAPRIQMIFQDSATAFNDRMTVRQIIEEPLVIAELLSRSYGKADEICDSTAFSLCEAVQAAMKTAGLNYEEFASRKPYELSGGQRQRVAIARALITNPDVIIADEPLTGLDMTAQMQIAMLFRRLADERGLAVLFIAHDRRMVERVSDRIIHLATES